MKYRNNYSIGAFFTSFFIPLVIVLFAIIINFLLYTTSLAISSVLLMFIGWNLAKHAELPSARFERWWPLIAPPCLFLLLIWLLWQIAPYTLASLLLMLYLPFWLAFLIRSEKQIQITRTLRGILTGLVILLLIGATLWPWLGLDVLPDDIKHDRNSIGHGVDVDSYMPFVNNNRLVKPASEPSLHIGASYPRLDGAIATLPIYGAAAQAIYNGLNEKTVRMYVSCTNTPVAYMSLIDGSTDVFVGFGPSQQQKKSAESKGLTLLRTPIAREAFVFITHKDNPIDNLTLEQIRSIYSRKITNWKDIGGEDERILAFQRPKNSGSQSTMLEMIMQGQPMAEPLLEEAVYGMGDLIKRVADYRNRKNSLGYSFRWYATAQFPSDDIKLLSINGIAPTIENIANGRYPLTANVEAITARKRDPEAQALIDWLTGPEGQDLIERTGYVPLNKN